MRDKNEQEEEKKGDHAGHFDGFGRGGRDEDGP